jgi:hypothetical protein
MESHSLESKSPREEEHWKDPDPDTIPQYLRIGHQGIISIDDKPLPGDATFNTLPVRHYLLGATIALQDGYYCPCGGSERTLDSFIYESASNTANILQSSVSPTNGVSPKGFEWLQRLGVKKFRYIYVSSSSEDIDLPFPNELTSVDIPDKLSLVVTEYPI